MPSDPIALPSMRASHARFYVLIFAVTLAILSYIDRVAISKAAPYISHDLGLSKQQMGLVFGAFALSYALAEIPSGWMGDLLGARSVLMRIVLWWSCFTASVTLMWSFTSLWINQFLFGAGEAGCFPNLTKAFSTWLPTPREGARPRHHVDGGTVGWRRDSDALRRHLCLPALARRFLFIFSGLGFIWAFLFFRWFRDNPRDHVGVNAAEWELLKGNQHMAGRHGDVPWGKMVRSRSVWLLWIQYFLMTYPWYLYITWLTTYLLEYRKMSVNTAAVYAFFPLAFGGVGCVVSGFTLPFVARMLGSMDRARRTVGTFGFVMAGTLIFVHTQTHAGAAGHARSRLRQLLQRHRDALRLGHLHGRRRQIRRHALGLHEHDGQLRRLRLAVTRWSHPAAHRQLEPVPLHVRFVLRPGGAVLAVPGFQKNAGESRGLTSRFIRG